MRDSRNNNMVKEEKQFDERVVAVDRVARVVKGGRRFRFRALVVAGDGKGQVGVGTGKGADVTAAVAKAADVAKKNMIKVNIENGTIAHEQESKVAGAAILIKPASEGTGLIAGGAVRVVLEVAGFRNMLSKSLGSTNKINIAYATVEALRNIKPRSEWHNAKAAKATSTKKSAEKKSSPKADSKKDDK